MAVSFFPTIFFFSSSSSSSFSVSCCCRLCCCCCCCYYYYYWSCHLLSLCHFAEFSYIKPHRLRIFPVNVWMRVCINCVQELKTNGLKWIVAKRQTHTHSRSLPQMRCVEMRRKFSFSHNFVMSDEYVWWYAVWCLWLFSSSSSSIITTHQNVLDIHWLLSKIAHTNRFFLSFFLLGQPPPPTKIDRWICAIFMWCAVSTEIRLLTQRIRTHTVGIIIVSTIGNWTTYSNTHSQRDTRKPTQQNGVSEK